MESESRGTVPPLIGELLENPRAFSFTQAIRLLRMFVRETAPDVSSEKLEELIRIRPKLALDFPETDVEAIELTDAETRQSRITATFLGVYGVSSPLPAFYTEELFEDASEDIHITREFLDLFHNPLYWLFYRVATRYHLPSCIIEEKDETVLERLYALAGLAEPELRRRALPESFPLLRYIGLFSQYPRSAASLKGLVADIAETRAVRIEQCVPTVVPIPEDQRTRLGSQACQLGGDAMVGDQIRDCTGSFSIVIGPISAETFAELLPGGRKALEIGKMVNHFLDQPLEWNVEIQVSRSAPMQAELGAQRWNRLGIDAWAGAAEPQEKPKTVRFTPAQLMASNQQRDTL